MESARRTVLIIDDDDDVHGLLRAAIDPAKYAVLSAIDGIEGLEKVMAHHPDLVILDVEMPRLGGREVLARIRHDPTTTTTLIVMLTDHAGVEDRREGFDLGADAYLEKPFSASTVARRVDYLIDLRFAAIAAAAAATAPNANGPPTRR